jgi:hemerythrin-like domain-containing protein
MASDLAVCGLHICAAPAGARLAAQESTVRRTAMNAIDLLKADHKKVKGLLEDLAGTTNRAAKKRTELLEKIRLEVEVHAAIEEEIFYPAFHQAGKTGEDEKLFFEALEEHRAVREFVLPDLQDTDVSSEQFSGRAKVVKDLILHHAEEEEKEMFPRAKKLLSSEELNQLGGELEARKGDLAREFSSADPRRDSRRRQRDLEVRA